MLLFFSDDEEKWSVIKEYAMEYVFAQRIDLAWHWEFTLSFSRDAKFVNLSDDKFFDVSSILELDSSNNTNVLGKIITRYRNMSFEQIQQRRDLLEKSLHRVATCDSIPKDFFMHLEVQKEMQKDFAIDPSEIRKHHQTNAGP